MNNFLQQTPLPELIGLALFIFGILCIIIGSFTKLFPIQKASVALIVLGTILWISIILVRSAPKVFIEAHIDGSTKFALGVMFFSLSCAFSYLWIKFDKKMWAAAMIACLIALPFSVS